MTCADRRTRFRAQPYDLAATLNSGQAFRWQATDGAFAGVVSGRWVRLTQAADGIAAEVAVPVADWRWLTNYLQVEADLSAVLATFPPDEPLRAAVRACPGLRLLRQDPWECLASFILSSTKQIVQIRQIVRVLCERYGAPVVTPAGHPPEFGFPAAERLATCTEAELRACKMGFRARYLRAAAERVAAGAPDLAALRDLDLGAARAALMALPGVGPKIADCVLLFAYGFQAAFPLDVWVLRALRQLYFPRQPVGVRRLRAFSETHFGPYAGYAQQYLFHAIRTGGRSQESDPAIEPPARRRRTCRVGGKS